MLDIAEFLHDHVMPNVDIPARIKTPVALHLTCSTRRMGLDATLMAVAQACAEHVVVPADIGCCAFAGDKGFVRPEMNAHALRSLAPAIKDCTAGYSTSRTCEIGLSVHGGVTYRSVADLVDSVAQRGGTSPGSLRVQCRRGGVMKIGLFIPCFIDAFFPEVGIATLQLLERFDLDVVYPPDQTCCGQPMANSGFESGCERRRSAVRPQLRRLRLHRRSVGKLRPSYPSSSLRRWNRPRRSAKFVPGPMNWSSFSTTSSKSTPSRGRAFRTRSVCTTAAARCAACATPVLRNCASRISPSRNRCCRKVEGLELVAASRPDECCGFGGLFSVVNESVSAKMGSDKVR